MPTGRHSKSSLSYQNKFEFDDRPITEEERKTMLSAYEENLRQLGDKFHTRFAGKGQEVTLNNKTAPAMLYKTEELLKAITILSILQSIIQGNGFTNRPDTAEI